jgi:hypothetical protein
LALELRDGTLVAKAKSGCRLRNREGDMIPKDVPPSPFWFEVDTVEKEIKSLVVGERTPRPF